MKDMQDMQDMQEKAVIVLRFDRKITKLEQISLRNWLEELPTYLPNSDQFTVEMYVDKWGYLPKPS
jgi:hypothetical protein